MTLDPSKSKLGAEAVAEDLPRGSTPLQLASRPSTAARWVARVNAARLAHQARIAQVVPLLALVIVIAAFANAPNFISGANVNNVLRQLPVLLTVGVGETFVVLIGGIDLSVAGNMTLAGAVAAVLTQHIGETGLLSAIAVGAVVGFANGVLVAKAKLPSFLVTLGVEFVVTGIALVVSGGNPLPYTGSVTNTLSFGSFGFLGGVPYLAAIGLGILVVCDVFATRTPQGRHLYAIGGGEEAARLSGVSVDRSKVMAFTLSGLLGGTAGLILTMRASSFTPNMGDPFLLSAIAAVVVGGTSLSGGIGGPRWTLLGALVMITLDNGMTIAALDPNWQIVIRGVAILLAAALTLRRLPGQIIK